MYPASDFFEAFASRPRPAPSELVRPAVNQEQGTPLRDLLASTSAAELTATEIRAGVEGNLWMLTTAAFRYYLPAFMKASLESYASISVFVAELVGALTEPRRSDIIDAIDQVTRTQSGPAALEGMNEILRAQQLEWFDSGIPLSMFHERFDDLTTGEGSAVLDFLAALQGSHGAEFPFKELDTAVERYWHRYRSF